MSDESRRAAAQFTLLKFVVVDVDISVAIYLWGRRWIMGSSTISPLELKLLPLTKPIRYLPNDAYC